MANTPNYDIDYFIQKFRSIPPEQWTVGEYINENGNCCALGHCGARYSVDRDEWPEEARALTTHFDNTGFDVEEINDLEVSIGDPRCRMLVALRALKRHGPKAIRGKVNDLIGNDRDPDYDHDGD